MRLLRNVGSTYLARAASMLTLLILFPLVSRSVGIQTYGVYLLITSVAVLLQTDLGLGSATVTRIAQALGAGDRARARAITASSGAMFLGLGIVATGAFIAVVDLAWQHLHIPSDLHRSAVIMTGLAAWQCLVTLGCSVSRCVLTAVHRLDLANTIQVVAAAIRIALTVWVIEHGWGIVAVTTVDTGTVTMIGISLWVARRWTVPDLGGDPRHISRAALRSLLSLNASLVVMSLAATVVMQASNSIVSVASGVAAVTVFGAGFRMYQLCKEATNSLALALLPGAAYAATDDSEIRRFFLTSTRYANALLCLAALPVLLLSRQLLDLWVGPDLATGNHVAIWLVVGLLVTNNHLVAIPVLTARSRLTHYAALHATWAVTSVALGFALASRYGATGMAIAFSAPVILLEPLYMREVLSELGISWREFLATCILPAALPALATGLLASAIVGLTGLEPTGADATITAALALSTCYALAFGISTKQGPFRYLSHRLGQRSIKDAGQ